MMTSVFRAASKMACIVCNSLRIQLFMISLICGVADAAPCDTSLLPMSYRSDAEAIKTEKTTALIGVTANTSSELAVNILTTPAAASANRYAAFYLPPSLAIVSRKGRIRELEQAAAAGAEGALLADGQGALLLVPLSSTDCRFFVLAPTAWKGAFLVGEALRRSGSDSASRFLDALFRSRYPDAPIVEDIESNGVSSARFAAEFANLMQTPVVVEDPSGILDSSTAFSTQEASAQVLPDAAAWRFETSKIAWPPSLKALQLRSEIVTPTLINILAVPVSERSPVQLKDDMTSLREILVEMRALGELALADLAALQAALPPTNDKRITAIYGQLLMLLQRIAVAEFDATVNTASSRYEESYAKLHGVPQITPEEPFDASKLLAYYPTGVSSLDKLTTLTIPDLSKLVANPPRALAGGETYLVFNDYRDPITQTAQVRPEFTMAFKIDILLAAAEEKLQAEIGKNSCERRFDHEPAKWTAIQGSLVGSMDVRLELWTCTRHTWVCFKGWKPKICKNEIKTRWIKTHGTIRVAATAMPKPNGLVVSYLISVPYFADISEDRLIPLDTTKLRDGSLLGTPWTPTHSFVTTRQGTGELVVLLRGTAPAFNADVANIKWMTIKQSLTALETNNASK